MWPLFPSLCSNFFFIFIFLILMCIYNAYHRKRMKMLLALPRAMQGAPAQGQPVPTAPLRSPRCPSLPGVWQWNKTKPALPSLKYCWALQSHILIRNYCILTLQYFPDYFPPVPALKIPSLYPLKSYRLQNIWFQNNLFLTLKHFSLWP